MLKRNNNPVGTGTKNCEYYRDRVEEICDRIQIVGISPSQSSRCHEED
jgi:hypothetical protein